MFGLFRKKKRRKSKMPDIKEEEKKSEETAPEQTKEEPKQPEETKQEDAPAPAAEAAAQSETEKPSLDERIDRLTAAVEKLVETLSQKETATDKQLEGLAEKYGMSSAPAGEAEKKSYTDEEIKNLLG